MDSQNGLKSASYVQYGTELTAQCTVLNGAHVRHKCFKRPDIVVFVSGRCFANEYYSAKLAYPAIGACAEHSTMTAWGKEQEEKATE